MFTLNCKGKLWAFDSPQVMGILNATPDSFYEGHLSAGTSAMLEMAATMVAEGATIIDVGGQSTRPGSTVIQADEEKERVLPLIGAVHDRFPGLIISIDTYYSEVAAEAVRAGASMVNDISAGGLDGNMLSTVAGLRVPYIAMHMQGTPQTMQANPQYTHVTSEILQYFAQRMADCRAAGIKDLIVDPGFGFGKTTEHNFTLLKELGAFRLLERPLLVGVSRKGMIWKTLNSSPDKVLNGTTVLNTIALLNGANILRVHDVKEAMEAIRLVEVYRGGGKTGEAAGL